MFSVVLFALAFLCPLLGFAIGSAMRRRLPEHHLHRDVIDVIKLAMGLMATVVALTLGLLISSAHSHHATIEGEYKKIMSGDGATHDKLVGDALKSLASNVDVIVLAQASMDRVVDALPAEVKPVPILSSPRSAVEHLAGLLGHKSAR